MFDQSGDDPRQRRRCLDPIAALAGEPNKIRHLFVPARDRRAVRDEAAQARPFMADMPDVERGRALQPIDTDGDVELVGLRVARLARRRIGRRDQQLPRVRLEIELFVDIVDQRPVIDRDATAIIAAELVSAAKPLTGCSRTIL